MIVQMKRLTLFCHREDEDRLLLALQDIGAVEILKTGDGEGKSPALEQAEQRLSDMTASLNAVRSYAKKPGLLAAKRRETLDTLGRSEQTAAQAAVRVEELTHSRAGLSAERDKAQDTLLSLQPWLSFLEPMVSVKSTDRVRYYLGFLAARDMDKLREQSYLMFEVYSEGAASALLAACHTEDANAAGVFFKTVDWTDVAFPHLDGTPAEAAERLRARIAELNREIARLSEALTECGRDAEALEDGVDTAMIVRDRAQAACELRRTRATVSLEGWCRADEQDKVEQAVRGTTDAYDLTFRDPEPDEVPPSVVLNSQFNTPFEAVNNLYSRPDPRGIDATPFMTPWYVLLFGMMLSDTGYGLLLALGTALYIRFKKPTGMSGGIARVLFWGGLSTAVWGVLIGTFFGVDFNRIFGTTGVFPLIMDPLSDPISMLILCFALGIVHMLCGYGIKVGMCFRNGDWQSAIFDSLSWMLIIVGIIVWLLPTLLSALPGWMSVVGLVMIGLGVLFILFFKGRKKRNPLSRMASGLGGLYDITGVLSDVLSYARLFALGIATGVIASVFNDICGMLMGGSGVLGALGFVIGCVLLAALHVFNLGINTLGAFVHCARLQYVEFYGKFYEAGGREFRPLSYRTRHSVITQ